MSAVRDAVLAALDSVVDWTSPDQRYLDLVSPGNSRAQQLADAAKSDCIYVALGVEEMVWDVPPHESPAPQVTLERRAGGAPMAPGGAMRRASFEAPPQAADAVWYGKSEVLNAEHVEHVRRIVFSRGPDGELTVATVDAIAGGEKIQEGEDGVVGSETIKVMKRTWNFSSHHGLWIDQETSRPIIGVVDADLMPYELRSQ